MPECEPTCAHFVSHTHNQSDCSFQHIPATDAGRTAPEQERQEDHEKGVGAEIGREGKVGIERRGAHFLLHPSQVRSLISDQWDELLARPIPPEGQSVRVYANAGLADIAQMARRTSCSCGFAYNGSGSSGQHRAALCFCPWCFIQTGRRSD